MSSQGNVSENVRTASLLLAMVAAFAVSCLTYWGILSYFFTGTDTLTLIEASRVGNFGDMVRVLTEPLMAGTEFVDVAKFYRPLTALSYSLDYAVWNLHPWGFQLTNLLLNALVAGLAVLLLFELSDRDLAFACLGGIIFAIHPILVECVPATDRRQDMLAAVFLLISLVLFIKHRRSGACKRLPIFFSVASYLLALAAKEIAVITLPLVFAQVFLFSGNKGFRDRFVAAWSGASAFTVVTVLYLAWRTRVLGGIGGYPATDPLTCREVLTYAANVLHNYITDLIYPADVFGIQESVLADWWTWLILALAAGYIAICVRRCGRWNGSGDNAPCIAMVQYLLIWLALPLLVFVVTLTFSHRSMYIPAIPFSALVAYPVAQSCRSLLCLVYGQRSRWSCPFRSWVLVRTLRGLVASAGAVFVIYVLAFSPLLRAYDHWQDSARITYLVLTQLAWEVQGVSPGYRIEVYDLPDRIRAYEKKIPCAKEVNYLRDYSIQSWLNLRFPKTSGKVVVRSRSWPWEFSGSLSVGLVRLSQRNLVAFVEMGAKSNRTSVARK